MVCPFATVVRVVLLEGGDGRVEIGVDFKKSLETDRIKHILYLFIGIEQFDMLLDLKSLFTVIAYGAHGSPALIQGGAILASENLCNAVQGRNSSTA